MSAINNGGGAEGGAHASVVNISSEKNVPGVLCTRCGRIDGENVIADAVGASEDFILARPSVETRLAFTVITTESIGTNAAILAGILSAFIDLCQVNLAVVTGEAKDTFTFVAETLLLLSTPTTILAWSSKTRIIDYTLDESDLMLDVREYSRS